MNNWHPIKTAPTDGTTVLLYLPTVNNVVSGKYGMNDWIDCWCANMAGHYRPSHWMPLPAPPENK